MGRGWHGKRGWWCRRFENAGLSFTRARKIILDILKTKKGHLSIEEIYEKLIKRCPGVNLTTVYRNLEVLTELGIVEKFDFGDGRARYELVEGPQREKHHHHLVCTSCGRVIDYTDFIDQEVELLQKTEKGLSKKHNFKISDHLIQFYGLCDRCRMKT